MTISEAARAMSDEARLQHSYRIREPILERARQMTKGYDPRLYPEIILTRGDMV